MKQSTKTKMFNIQTQNVKPNHSESFNTTEESIMKLKLQTSSDRSYKCYPNIRSTYYSPQTTQQSSYISKNHSILSRFQREMKSHFASTIKKEISQLSQAATTFKKGKRTKGRILNHPMFLKKYNLKSNDNANANTNANTNAINNEMEKDFNTIPLKALSITTNTEESSINFNEPMTIKNSTIRIRKLDPNITIDPKWRRALGLYSKDTKTEACLVKDLKYQSHYLRDEMKLLLDNIQYYKEAVLSSNDILSALKNKSIKSQTSHNKLLEEQCVLLDKIPRKLLKDFYGYADKFITLPTVFLRDYDQKEIKSEADCFVENARLLNQLFTFLKSCFEVYLILIKEADDILLSPKDFEYLSNVIEKARYNMNMIITTAKNWVHDLNFDRNLIHSYKKKLLIKDYEKGEDDLSNQAKDQKDFISDIIRTQLNFRKSDEAQKKQRINESLRPKKKLFGQEKPKEEKKGIMVAKHKSLINCSIMNKILKYCRKDVREQIISLKTTQRFYEKL